MKKLRTYLALLVILLGNLSFSIAVAINFTPLFKWSLTDLSTSELSREVIMKNYTILLNYLNNPWIQRLNMPNFESSAQGLFHFSEVKKLFMLNYSILAFSLIFGFFLIRYLKKKNELSALIKLMSYTMYGPLTVLILLLVNFDRIFILFHEVFFNNEAWIFNPSIDPIINLLPQSFFLACFIFVFILFEVQLILTYLLLKKNLRRNYEKNQPVINV